MNRTRKNPQSPISVSSREKVVLGALKTVVEREMGKSMTWNEEGAGPAAFCLTLPLRYLSLLPRSFAPTCPR